MKKNLILVDYTHNVSLLKISKFFVPTFGSAVTATIKSRNLTPKLEVLNIGSSFLHFMDAAIAEPNLDSAYHQNFHNISIRLFFGVHISV